MMTSSVNGGVGDNDDGEVGGHPLDTRLPLDPHQEGVAEADDGESELGSSKKLKLDHNNHDMNGDTDLGFKESLSNSTRHSNHNNNNNTTGRMMLGPTAEGSIEQQQFQPLQLPQNPRIRSDGKKHVEKGSLKLEDLIQAKQDAASRIHEAELSSSGDNGGGGSASGDHDQARKDQKRAANRLSAFQSRQRRKIIIEDLQRTVAQLSKDNAQHCTTISQLRLQLDATRTENDFLRAQVVATRALAIPAVAASQPPSVTTAPTPPPPPSQPNGSASQPAFSNSNNNNGTTSQASSSRQFPLQASSMNYQPPVAGFATAASTGTSVSVPGTNPLPPSQPQQLTPAGTAPPVPAQVPWLNPEVLSLLQELAVIQHQMQQQQQQQQQQHANQGPPSGM